MILVCVGTRPELIKMAPVCALAKSRGLPIHVHCTMQSPDLVDRSILPWDTADGVKEWSRDYPNAREAAKKSGFIVVQGDTRTAYETAVEAYEEGIPVFHLEAGVRTYDLASPWPEEGYRQMISRIATYHACTTTACMHNLLGENGHLNSLFPTHHNQPAVGCRVTGSPIVESVRGRLDDSPKPVHDTVALTLHRKENRGHFADILMGVAETSMALGNRSVAVMWPQHPNGWARAEWPADRPMTLNPRPPMGATEFTRLLQHSLLAITDSGGVQEECNALGIPCVVARTITDRPESLGKGGAILAGNTREGVATAIRKALQMDRSTIQRDIFGDGKASERIVDWWQEIVG